MTNNMNLSNKRRNIIIGLLAILTLSFFLNTSALDWGQTGSSDWSPDTIEGRITAIYMPYMFKMWMHKYPRGQYIINSIFYRPKINTWEKNLVQIKNHEGKAIYSPLNQPRLYELASISRWISVWMSLGILIAVFFTTKKLLYDSFAALMATLCLALSCDFMFYSKSGCVDIPAFFWFAWAGCFGIYAIKSNKLIYFILAGFCAAWSVCTKEGVATFNVGLFIAILILMVWESRDSGKTWKDSFKSLLNWKLLTTVVVGALVFITLEGLWAGTEEWHYRSKFWKGVVKDEFQSQNYSVWFLSKKTYECLVSSWGKPFIFFLPFSIIYWIIKFRKQLILALVPALSFFLLTVLVVEQNLPRFMMCSFAGIAIIIGKTLADWIRNKKNPIVLKVILPVLILIPSLICCVCENLEMKNDTRIRAENWIKSNVPKGTVFGMSMGNQYAPRVRISGYPVIEKWSSKGVNTKKGLVKYFPEYIIASNKWPCFTTKDKDYFRKMFKNETPYKHQVTYSKLYFTPKSILWKYCLRFFKPHAGISPPIMLYKKDREQIKNVQK